MRSIFALHDNVVKRSIGIFSLRADLCANRTTGVPGNMQHMATTSTIGAEERRAHLLAILRRDNRIHLESAASELGVSAMTVRRDLADLETNGELRRVRGGAVASLRPRSFTERMSTGAPTKLAIARKALALVPISGAVAFDASSTAGTLICGLSGPDLIVATNSFDNFQAARRTAGSAILVGGEAEERTDSFVGFIACQAAAALEYRCFFTSAAGVDPARGISEVTLAEAQVKVAFADSSDEIVLLIDSSKLGQRALARALDWGRIDTMVTELDPLDAELDPYRDLVQLI